MFINTSIAVKGFENLVTRQIFWLPEKGGLPMLVNIGCGKLASFFFPSDQFKKGS
jgi:hypothetical protein